MCDDLGMDMFCVSGGSASSLWGTLFQGFSEAGAAEAMDAPTLKAFLLAGLRGMQEVSTARVGDKTMMDALIPAVEAAVSAGNDIGSILQAASDAASAGMENSKRFASRFGRAKSYGEQTIGTPDAGAASTAFFFNGLLQGYQSLQP